MLLNGIHLTNCYSVFRVHLICLKNGKFATFGFLSFQLKLQYFKYSLSVFSENSHALPEIIVLIYSKIFFNTKFKFSRKCQNKSVCIRRFLRCTLLMDLKELSRTSGTNLSSCTSTRHLRAGLSGAGWCTTATAPKSSICCSVNVVNEISGDVQKCYVIS